MGHPTLRLFDGMENTSPQLQDDVKELQADLNQFGFNIQVDGLFGSETDARVRQFQVDQNLTEDGIVGPQTWATLEGTAAPQAANTFLTTISNSDAGMRAQFTQAQTFKAFIDAGAQRISVPSAVIAGIGSRESGWGLNLRPPGPGGTGDFGPRKFPTALRTGPLPPDGGYGRGLMQIDFDAFDFARTGNWKDPAANIDCGCNVLKSNIVLLGGKTALTGRDLLRAAIAGYNCGAGNVLTAIKQGRDLDFFTSGRNYSADVLNRAGFFQNMGWESPAQPVSAAGTTNA
ncbi:MAG TPA: peptidoglycan-binding protein [Candidatus Angelobacter sp.]